MRDDPQAFARLHARVLAGRAAEARWLLLIDQFEEVFTSVEPALAASFLDQLLAALARGRLGIVATVRADFLDVCIAHPGLRTAMNDGDQFNVDAPDTGALRAMITGPLRQRVLAPEYRADIEEALVERLARDAGGQPGGLALLAFALKDLYDACRAAHPAGQAERPVMRLADYLPPADAGISPTPPAAQPTPQEAPPTGLHRIIRTRAEAAVTRAGVDLAAVLPRVFSRLVTVSADGTATRLRANLADWADDPDALRLIEELTHPESRLLSCTARADGAAPSADTPRGRVVEVAHEALFRAWPALAEWIEGQQEALFRRPALLRDAAGWHAAGRPDQGLPTHMRDDLRRLFDAAGLWAGMVKDLPPVAHFLARDDPDELLALTLRARGDADTDPAARTHLLHTLTRFERRTETLTALVERLRAHDTAQGTDLLAWLRVAIDLDALFAGPDAARWHWHRVAIGDLLDALGDDRDGVGVDGDGLPAIAWCAVPAGEFLWQDGETRETGAFRIARYPITNRQYRAFTEADDYGNPDWWQEGYRAPPPGDPKWTPDNRPRVNVAWVEALAFCLWLTARLRARGTLTADEVIRLPTEPEWEKAARGADGRTYPWGNDYRGGDANIDETYDDTGKLHLRQTTAVGLYPGNRSPYGLLDCAGNVWDWCLNKYDDVEDADLGGQATRAVRGGGWGLTQAAARVSYRSWNTIDARNPYIGVRFVCAGPIL